MPRPARGAVDAFTTAGGLPEDRCARWTSFGVPFFQQSFPFESGPAGAPAAVLASNALAATIGSL